MPYTIRSSIENTSTSDWQICSYLSILLGWMAADHFYVGRYVTGIAKAVTVGGFGIWWVLDIFAVLDGQFHDSKGAVVRRRSD